MRCVGRNKKFRRHFRSTLELVFHNSVKCPIFKDELDLRDFR
jgi:hypothetical protein